MEPIVLDGYYTLIFATIVLILGRFFVAKIKFLQDFNIPEAVAGGLIVAALIFALYQWNGMSFKFDTGLKDAFMLVFFASVGLSADFSRLKQGGIPLVIFLIVVSGLIVIQNVVGVSLASVFGLDPKLGLITGSITLTGGHGTGAAWAKTFQDKYALQGVTEMAMASATFGLVAGGLIGGPVARHLVNKLRLGKKAHVKKADASPDAYDGSTFEDKDNFRYITATSVIETMALFAACLVFSKVMKMLLPDSSLPQFVWALGFGVILRNVLTKVFKFDMFDRAIDVFGNASLSLFLAIALMDIKLWELSGLAGPMLIILLVQTVVMILYGYFVTFRVMGKDYDAAILTAGHCGFGLGATPTAVANMQSVTEKFGPSHKAFLIVPLVGAFFVDLVNLFLITSFLEFLG